MAAAARERRPLPRNVRVLSLVSLLQDAASELLYPLLPTFLTVTLGAPVAAVGLIEGIAEATASVTKAVAGRLADGRRKKPFVTAGYGIAAVAKGLLAVAFAWPVVVLLRALDRVGKGIRGGPRDALLALEVAPEDRGRAFGLHRAADTTGAVVGPLLGLAAYEALHHRLRLVFLLALIPAAASTLLTRAVREGTIPARPPATSSAKIGSVEGLPSSYWRAVALLAGFAVCNFPDALVLLRLKALGFGVPATLLAYCLYNASYAALSYPAGVVSDRLSRPTVLAAGFACFALGYGGLGLVHSAWPAWPLLVVYGACPALTDGVGKAWIADRLPRHRLAGGLGLQQAVVGGGALVAGIWAGLLWHGDGRLPMLLAGAGGAVAAVAALAAARGEGRPAPVEPALAG